MTTSRLFERTGRPPILRRRSFLASSAAGALLLTGCDRKTQWHETDVSGDLPRLDFSMTDAATGAPVTAGDFRGKIVLLYFGYTLCPDFCPTTLANLGTVLQNLGAQASQVRVLFVTVDPNRDTIPVLRRYVALFGPQMVGLRGTPDQLANLARRYRVAYSVTPAHGSQPYTVTHSSIVYVFDQNGDARLLVSSMATPAPDIAGATADLRTLIARNHPPGLLERIENSV